MLKVCKNASVLYSNDLKLGLLNKLNYQQEGKRFIWGWLNSIFNKVDLHRINEVGADRACAEWLLRCGAKVKWVNSENWNGDYNSLPIAGNKSLKIAEVDATDSAIMHIGFPHFQNCKYINRLILHKAIYIDNEAMEYLPLLKALEHLQVSSIGDVTDEGLQYIKKLRNLKTLLLYDLPSVKDNESVLKDLQEALPECNVEFPHLSEIKSSKK